MQYAPDSLHHITWNQITDHSLFRLIDSQIIPEGEEVLREIEGAPGSLITRLTNSSL